MTIAPSFVVGAYGDPIDIQIKKKDGTNADVSGATSVVFKATKEDGTVVSWSGAAHPTDTSKLRYTPVDGDLNVAGDLIIEASWMDGSKQRIALPTRTKIGKAMVVT